MSSVKRHDIFDNPALWEEYGKDSSAEEERIHFVLSNIPEDIKSVVDVGCGSGVILNQLENLQTIGIDGCFSALKYVKGPCLHGDVASLPFPDNEFDLAISCEVLEHLPEEVLDEAVSELIRVTRRYLLVTVPCRENLSLHTLKCPQCRTVFHRNGHVNSFDMSQFKGLFNRMKVLKSEEFGPSRSRYREGVISGLQQFGLCFGDPTTTASCPSCGCSSFSSPSRLDRRIRRYARKVGGFSMRPERNWIFLLLEKMG